MEEKLKQLGLEAMGANYKTSPTVYTVMLNPNDFSSDAVQSQFDQQAKQKPQKKDRKWLGRPSVEQGPSPRPDFQLEKIGLANIATQVNHIWFNKIFFCRTLRSPFYRSNSLWVLVEDTTNDDGFVMTLSLWNYVPLRANDQVFGFNLELDLPNGTFLAITQPLMVPNNLVTTDPSTNDPSLLMIRCDNPQCVEIFDSEDEWKQAMEKVDNKEGQPTTATKNTFPASQLKEKGNEAFGKNAYFAALRWYQQALDVATKKRDVPIAISCLGNMAEACLVSGQYEQAEDYARQILKEYDPNHPKARFRLARALLYRNRPKEAKDIVFELRKEDPKNESLQTLLGDCLQAILEKSMGKYNIRKMLGEASLSPEVPFHADYQSPKIDLGVSVVRPADGGTYRGVLAKEVIKEGTLLTASRAFAFAYRQRGSFSEIAQAAQKKHMYEVSQVHQAVNRIANNPSLVASFYRLEAAGEISNEKNDENHAAPIDLAKIRSILESNRFGVDLNSPSTPFELKPPSEEGKDDCLGVGLWLPTSMFNHSCTPNCTWTPIGNHMFVYAAKDVKEGDELCISYVHAALSYLDRKDRFQRWSGGKGFECGCEWCHLMRRNTELRDMNEEVVLAQKRGQLLSSVRRGQIKQAHADLPDCFQHTVYSIHMMEALQLANDMDRQGARKAVQAAVSLGYAIRGGLRQETRVQDLCCLAAASMVCNEDGLARKALEELCQYQVALPSLKEFHTFVMMSSMAFWNEYQSEPFMQRWATIIKEVWEKRSKQLR